MTDEDTPKCNKCGAELTTGLMAVFCPLGKECEFYPEDRKGQAFVEELCESSKGNSCIGNDGPGVGEPV